MDSNSFLMRDNVLYLNAWIQKNPKLQALKIVNSDLIWQHDQVLEKVNLNHFYLPTLLYNPMFQHDIQYSECLNAEDLFRIIRVHILADEYFNS